MTGFRLPGSDPELLKRASALAASFADRRIDERTVGVVFLGGIARGYFDGDADIDIAIFEESASDRVDVKTEAIEGFEVQTFVSDYAHESSAEWSMGKRWAYSTAILHYDREKMTEGLLARKVPLGAEERRRLMLAGITLSEWYCNRLPMTWVRRGDPMSAHFMFNEGINHFLAALYAFNGELVPDHKWLIHCAAGLASAPGGFREGLSETMRLGDVSERELERRRNAFLGLWRELLPMIEDEVKMKYEDFRDSI